MPWLETEPMNEKVKFISAYIDNHEDAFQILCERFNISRKTGYKYVQRYKAEGIDGLKERSRTPHCRANQTPAYIEQAILEVKSCYPRWGSKKVLNWLLQEKSLTTWPARSTIDELFKKHNLIRPRKRKRRVAPYTTPFTLCTKPNDVWSIDYKGQFALGNQEICYPLTVTDNFSRYVLAIKGSKQISGKETRQTLHKLFSELGLPLAVRSDNGSPFAGTGLAGLSKLAVWLIKLGITPERIRPGHPEENGRHERMHFTLKQETALPSKFDHKKQQRCFDDFKKMFNEQRPHEGINFSRPNWLYIPSNRSYPKKIASVEYDTDVITRGVRSNGAIKWKGKDVFVSETLEGERIALKPHNQDEWIVYFSFLPIGIFNERVLKINKI
jgi:putative transposase